MPKQSQNSRQNSRKTVRINRKWHHRKASPASRCATTDCSHNVISRIPRTGEPLRIPSSNIVLAVGTAMFLRKLAAEFIILNTKFLVFDTQFLVFNAEFLVLNAKLIIFTHANHIVWASTRCCHRSPPWLTQYDSQWSWVNWQPLGCTYQPMHNVTT